MGKPALVLNRLSRLFRGQVTFSGLQSTPFRVLVATMLSARTRDQTTAKVSEALFARYPAPEALARAPIRTLEKILHPIGFYRSKSRNVKKLAKQLIRRHGGRVPDRMEDLVDLSGVGRKTASCVLNYAFQKPAIAVDVHVFRISHRLGLVRAPNLKTTEVALKKIYPRAKWRHVNSALVLFGQNLCLPRNPKCGICVLNEICPSRQCIAELPLKARFLESEKIVARSWRNDFGQKD